MRARQHLAVRWASPFVFCRSSDDSGGVSPASFRRVLGERGRVLRVTQGLRWPAVACETESQRQDTKPPGLRPEQGSRGWQWGTAAVDSMTPFQVWRGYVFWSILLPIDWRDK